MTCWGDQPPKETEPSTGRERAARALMGRWRIVDDSITASAGTRHPGRAGQRIHRHIGRRYHPAEAWMVVKGVDCFGIQGPRIIGPGPAVQPAVIVVDRAWQ